MALQEAALVCPQSRGIPGGVHGTLKAFVSVHVRYPRSQPPRVPYIVELLLRETQAKDLVFQFSPFITGLYPLTGTTTHRLPESISPSPPEILAFLNHSQDSIRYFGK